MKVCPFRRISNPALEICPNVLLTGKSSRPTYMEKVFLYCHSPTEHTVILVGSILQVFLVGRADWPQPLCNQLKNG